MKSFSTGVFVLTFCLYTLGTGAKTHSAPGVFEVREFGAKADGKTSDTVAINKAVEACASSGGGQVLLSPGKYVAGTIHLQSDVTFHLAPGAVLIGTTNLEEYVCFKPPAGTPEAKFRPEWHRAMILAVNATNVTISGSGIIDGNRVFDARGEERMRGPHTILLGHCRDITIRDLVIRDSANYAIMMEDCSDADLRNLRITGGWDGVHFRGWPDRVCRNINIINCQIYTGDDSIAGRYWENVVISDCIINSSCNGIRLIGPADHLIIRNTLFYGPGLYPHRTSNRTNMLAAVALQPGAWDPTFGKMDNVLLSDLTIHNVTTPFHFAVKGENTAGRVTVNRVSATGVYRTASTIETWNEAKFETVTFRDVDIEFVGGGTPEDAKLEIKAPGVDARKLPVWGFYARNVESLNLDGVRLSTEKPDGRPVIQTENVSELRMHDVKFPKPPEGTEGLKLERTKQVSPPMHQIP